MYYFATMRGVLDVLDNSTNNETVIFLNNLNVHPQVTITRQFGNLWLLFNPPYLIQFIIKSSTKGHFQNQQDEQISKLSLVVLIDKELNEIFKVKA